MSITMVLNRLAVNNGSKTYIKLIANRNCLWRSLSDVPSERKADFVPRVITEDVFPDLRAAKLKRGTGGRSSFNGQIVTVFGANGFLGRSVCNQIAKVGAQLIIPYRGDSYDISPLKLVGDLGQVLFFHYHLKDVDALYKVMKYSNVVINLIGKSSETNNFSFDAVHVEGARAIARAAKQVGVKRLIHVSALNVTPNPTPHVLKNGSDWLRSKYYGELAVREEFPEAIIFRPADIYGPLDSFSSYYCKDDRILKFGIAIPNGGYDIYKQPVSVFNVAQGILNSITDDESPGTTYEAIGPRKYELRELIEYINRITQRTPEYGFKIYNLRWTPLFRLRITYKSTPKSLRKYPTLCWERIERECISDEPTGCPTLEDLGVKLDFLENRFPYDLFVYREFCYYSEETGELPKVDPPKIAYAS